MLSPFEHDLIDRAVKLRAFVRAIDAPSLHKLLSEQAEFLLAIQKDYAKRREDMETLVRSLESLMALTANWNTEAGNVIRRYRLENPRKD